jgi:hypothetical protein
MVLVLFGAGARLCFEDNSRGREIVRIGAGRGLDLG